MPKVLLHSCCACCASAAVQELKQKGHYAQLFYCDSNISPKEEWLLRFENLRRISLHNDVLLFMHKYDHESWLSHIKGLESEPEGGSRCEKCFEFRLSKAADFAKQNEFEAFTTTLTISPHKDSKKIFEIGRRVSQRYGIPFLEIDFKKNNGFKKSIDLSKELNLYRQNYCGCEFSRGNKK